MSLRRWLSLVSILAIIILLAISWKDILKAWELLLRVEWWLLILVIPLQILSYYATGEVLASFLRAKGELKHVSRLEIVRFSLEFNFVNHILPTGGLSGVSYANWRFKHMGVSVARATLANALKFIVTFCVFMVMLLGAVFILALDGNINRLTLLFSGTLSTLIVVATLLFAYVISSTRRVTSIGRQFTKTANAVIKKVVRRENVIKEDTVIGFMQQMHSDYLELRRHPRQLRAPIIWAAVFLVLEVGMFAVVFASLGEFVNPAALLLAYGFAGFAGAFVATPGGAGAYEAVMISFLGGAGVPQGVAIAGVLLTRVILIILTIITGYVFYQLTLIKYGGKKRKHKHRSNPEEAEPWNELADGPVEETHGEAKPAKADAPHADSAITHGKRSKKKR